MIVRAASDGMAINGNRGRRIQDCCVFIVNDPRCTAAEIIKQVSQSSFSHFERERRIFLRQPALFVISLYLVKMDKPVCIQDAGIRKDLGSTVLREAAFQCNADIPGDFTDQGILSVLKNGDLIPGLIAGVKLVVPVRNKTGARNNGANAFSGLLAHLPLGRRRDWYIYT